MSQPAAKTKTKPTRKKQSGTTSTRRSASARSRKPASTDGSGPVGRKPQTPAKRPSRFTWRGFLKRSIYLGMVLGVWAFVAGLGVIAYYAYDLPNPEKAFTETRRPMVIVRAADGSEITRVGDLYGQASRLSDLPPALPAAVLATEDRRFYDHYGIDPIGLARAMFVNVQAGRIRQGGSTLTQQVAKNLFLTSERSIKRKVQEVLLALWLENRFSKDQILEVYLNRVYLGGGTYGVDAAARHYFKKPVKNLSVYQSAMIAGLLKAPSKLNPRANPAAAVNRTQQVLANMVAAGYLTSAEAKQAIAGTDSVSVSAPSGFAKYFAYWALDRMGDHVTVNDSDAILRTTLDPALQRATEQAVHDAFADGPKQKGYQVAVVVLDGSGAVRTMIGGTNYASSPFNRAAAARRQPGSAFKPFVYLAGLEAGMRPMDTLEDAPVQIGSWRPKNFSGGYRGPVTMSDALAFSINTVAVRVARRAGAKEVAEVGQRLGAVQNLEPDLSIALGTSEVTLMDLAQAYVPFANGGYGVIAHGVHSVLDDRGADLYTRSGSGAGTVITAENLGSMNGMLSRAVEIGTGKAARPAGAPIGTIAGKTGTSQDHRDAWFVGYSVDRVVAVWVGNDDASPMDKVTGGALPARIAKEILKKAQGGRRWQRLPGLNGGSIVEPANNPASLPRILDGLVSLFETENASSPVSALLQPPTFKENGR